VLAQAMREQEHLNAMLLAERDESRRVKEQARADADTHERRIRELSSDLATATSRLHLLEEQVLVAAREKREAELKAASLSNEIDQARTALADEWGDHMTAQERLAAAVEEKNLLEKSLHPAGDGGPVAALPAIITRTSSLPVSMPPAPLAFAIGQTPAGKVPRATLVEDLFEDDEPAHGEDEEEPVVTIVRETDPEVTIPLPPVFADSDVPEDTIEWVGEPGPAAGDAGESADHEAVRAEEEDVPGEGDVPEEEDETEEEDVPEEDGEESGTSGVPTQSPYSISPMGFSFNRTQWLDLLKWAHHSGALSQDQRLQIIRMGRLIQQGRRLTHKQDEQVREMIGLAHSLGYRFS
jgi:hypothetical protein